MLFFRAHASPEIYLDYYSTNLMRNRILSSVWSMFLLILSGKGKLHWNVFINQPCQIIRYWKPYFRNKCLHSWFSFFLQPWLTHLFNTEWGSMISRLINLRDMRRSQIIQIPTNSIMEVKVRKDSAKENENCLLLQLHALQYRMDNLTNPMRYWSPSSQASVLWLESIIIVRNFLKGRSNLLSDSALLKWKVAINA